MGEFTLTDNIRDSSAKLSPSIFLRLAQLQGPLAPLFPNLRRLRIVAANYSLDYLHLFLSPSLETLEIVGLGEASRATLLSFLSDAVVRVPNLSTLILGSGRLSREVVDACLSFGRLKHLELVDVVSEVDYKLLKDIGRLEHLETFVIDALGVQYAPSQVILQAEEEERARVIVEEELRRQQIEEQEQENRRRFEEEVAERRRKASLPRVEGVCWMCGRRFKKATHKTVCSFCSLEIVKQEEHMQELEVESQRRARDPERRSARQRKIGAIEAQRKQEAKEEEEELLRLEREAEACRETAEEDPEDEMEDLEVRAEIGRSVIDDSPPTDGLDASSTPDVPEADAAFDDQEEPLRLFPKLLNITVRGSPEMMQDVVQLITSASVALLCLEMVPVLSSNIATPPSRRFVDTVDSALRRWAGTIAHVTLSNLPSVVSKLPDETIGALLRLPHLEHLELNGWDVVPSITDYFTLDTGVSKLKVLHLSDDANAVSMPLSELTWIAITCPDLLSLRCRLDSLLDILEHSFKLFSHSLEILTVGDTSPALDFTATLKIADILIIYSPRSKISSLLKLRPRTPNNGGTLMSWSSPVSLVGWIASVRLHFHFSDDFRYLVPDLPSISHSKYLSFATYLVLVNEIDLPAEIL